MDPHREWTPAGTVLITQRRFCHVTQNGARMLILTTASALPLGRLPPGSGPRVLVLQQGEGAPPVGADMITIRYLQPPVGIVQLLCDVAELPHHRTTRDPEPLVYLDSPADPVDLQTMFAPTGTDMPMIEAGFADTGNLGRLRLDNAISSSPLWPAFLTSLRDAPVGDRQFVGLLSSFFPGAPA